MLQYRTQYRTPNAMQKKQNMHNLNRLVDFIWGFVFFYKPNEDAEKKLIDSNVANNSMVNLTTKMKKEMAIDKIHSSNIEDLYFIEKIYDEPDSNDRESHLYQQVNTLVIKFSIMEYEIINNPSIYLPAIIDLIVVVLKMCKYINTYYIHRLHVIKLVALWLFLKKIIAHLNTKPPVHELIKNLRNANLISIFGVGTNFQRLDRKMPLVDRFINQHYLWIDTQTEVIDTTESKIPKPQGIFDFTGLGQQPQADLNPSLGITEVQKPQVNFDFTGLGLQPQADVNPSLGIAEVPKPQVNFDFTGLGLQPQADFSPLPPYLSPNPSLGVVEISKPRVNFNLTPPEDPPQSSSSSSSLAKKQKVDFN